MAEPVVYGKWRVINEEPREFATCEWVDDFAEKEFLYCEGMAGYDEIPGSEHHVGDSEFAETGVPFQTAFS